jgi:CRISPR-associated exonuclease Cas4
MKLSQNSFNENEVFITPSDMIEFMYCKRFIYYMKCLGIEQYEEKRYKVEKGRKIHEERRKHNRDYLRKRIGSVSKQLDVNLVSRRLGVRGKVDEIHVLANNEMVPLDYKFAEYDDRIYKTYKTQMVLYALLIQDVFGTIVNRGYLIYCRGGNKLVEINISDKDKKKALKSLDEYKAIMNGYFPRATPSKSKCMDCCYKNICIK